MLDAALGEAAVLEIQKGSVTLLFDAGVAQLAEHLLCKQGVAGSIPVAGSKLELA